MIGDGLPEVEIEPPCWQDLVLAEIDREEEEQERERFNRWHRRLWRWMWGGR